MRTALIVVPNRPIRGFNLFGTICSWATPQFVSHSAIHHPRYLFEELGYFAYIMARGTSNGYFPQFTSSKTHLLSNPL